MLHRAMRQRGLDQCVDLIEVATTEQLNAILDLDLWSAPLAGQGEQFDADRFGEWLEALVGHGAATAARVVERLDVHLAATGLSRFVRVFDPGVLMPTAPSDDEPREGGLFEANGAAAEIGGYVVQARREDAWDAIVELLAVLSADRAACFNAIMQECRRLSNGSREPDGLDDLLDAPDQSLHDLGRERDDRRAERGFGTWADARAFLAAARERPPSGRSQDPAAVAKLRPAGDGPGGLRPLIEYLLRHHPDAYFARGRELAFLANAFVAGCRLRASSFTPSQAVQAAVATCNLGLLLKPAPPAPDYLVGGGLIGLFEDGWGTLHREVSLFVAEGLLAVLSTVPVGDSDTLEGLHTLERSLETHLAAGMPWLAVDDLDVLSVLDMPAWYGLCGLLSECPVIPDAVTAVVERRTRRIAPDAFAFIGTDAQIRTVRAFMARLPHQLAG